jgi:hypothetical protein
MSDEPKKRREWPTAPSAVLLLAALAAYQGAHYATAGFDFDDGCFAVGAHAIKGHRAPEWIESFFSLADRIDRMIGVDAYREPIR